MKKWVFGLVLVISLVISGFVISYAEVSTMYGYEYIFLYDCKEHDSSSVEVTWYFASNDPGLEKIQIVLLDENCKEDNAVLLDTITVDETDAEYDNGNFVRYFVSGSFVNSYYFDYKLLKCTLKSSNQGLNITLFGDDTNLGRLTPTPIPMATATPKPTATTAPTATPKPSPTNTPKPTPTNTPTPTPSPTPAPILRLNAYVDGNKAVAEYYTGGCTPVKSSIEYYEIDVLTDSLMKIDGETFISGEGSRTDSMVAGKTYRYKLTYVYQRSGVQYTEELWSGDLTLVDHELEDYKKTGQINNYRTLIIYTWENIMDMEMPIEGFNIKFQTLFIWIMIAGAGVFFFKKWNGS